MCCTKLRKPIVADEHLSQRRHAAIVDEVKRFAVWHCRVCQSPLRWIYLRDEGRTISVHAEPRADGRIAHTGDGYGNRIGGESMAGSAYVEHSHIGEEIAEAVPGVTLGASLDMFAVSQQLQPTPEPDLLDMFGAAPAPRPLTPRELSVEEANRRSRIMASNARPTVIACERCGRTEPRTAETPIGYQCPCGGWLTDAAGKLHDAGILMPREQEAAVAREASIAQVDTNAPDGWRDAAIAAIVQVARTHHQFTADDVWDTGLPVPPTPSALGPAFRSAAGAGVCEPTNMVMPSRYAQRHRDLKVWRSCMMPALPMPPIEACTSCGAQIVKVAHATKGTIMPLDAVPTRGGTWRVNLVENGFVATHHAHAEIGLTSHFATCPNAAAHRTRGPR